jgi:hypothetical protein
MDPDASINGASGAKSSAESLNSRTNSGSYFGCGTFMATREFLLAAGHGEAD